MSKLSVVTAGLSCLLILSSEVSAEETAELGGVVAQDVWEELQSRETVTFSVVRDTVQFLVVNLAWVAAGLLLWRGPAGTRDLASTGQGEEGEGEEGASISNTVDLSRLNNFFMNPNKVARNMYVCTSLVGNLNSHKTPGECS